MQTGIDSLTLYPYQRIEKLPNVVRIISNPPQENDNQPDFVQFTVQGSQLAMFESESDGT